MHTKKQNAIHLTGGKHEQRGKHDNPNLQRESERNEMTKWDKLARELLKSLMLAKEQSPDVWHKALANALMLEYLRGFEDGTTTERTKHERQQQPNP
jgi:hypothetical protein